MTEGGTAGKLATPPTERVEGFHFNKLADAFILQDKNGSEQECSNLSANLEEGREIFLNYFRVHSCFPGLPRWR